MQLNIVANKYVKMLFIISISIYLLFIFIGSHVRSSGDDASYLSVFNSHHIINTLAWRYHKWSGRLAIEWVMVATIGYSLFWKVGIPLSVCVVCYSCCRISGVRCNVLSFSFALFLFAVIPYDINSDASWWVAGFYNYLLPVSASIYVFSILFCGESNKIEKILCILLSFYFPYMEQVGVAFVMAMVFWSIQKRKSLSVFDIIVMVVVCVNLIICLKAPGNRNRFILEVWNWYPQYQTYGITNRIALGFDKLHQLMTFRYNMPLIFFIILLFVTRSLYGKMTYSIKFSMFIVATFISLSVGNALTGLFSSGYFFNPSMLSAERWCVFELYISYMYIFFVISSVITILFDCCVNKITRMVPFFAMIIGFFTVVMLGLSPTVYASGYRVDFIFEISCIISCVSLISSLENVRCVKVDFQ
ncbi:MAG: hypothetical protein ABF646_09665 [Acetobacter papayae]